MLAEKLNNYKVILASNSPRRQKFFQELNIPFEVKTKYLEEIYPSELRGSEITDYLSILKSQAFGNLESKELLITSDTIVWHKNKALGKPKDRNEAINMLKSLSDNSNDVITSICIRTQSLQKVIHDITKVTFNKLSEEEILYYIDNFKPFDKAGAYGIQEWIGYIGVKKIEGSFFNVVGLPIHKLYKELMSL